MLHAVIPMAGEGSRFKERGYDLPKPMVLLQNRPLFYWAAACLSKSLPLASLTFVVLLRHIHEFAIDACIRAYFPQARIVVVPSLFNGPVLTCMAGVADLPDDEPILFNDCDHLFHSQALIRLVHSDLAGKIGHGGSLVSFFSDHPAFSYLVESSPGVVAATVEKRAVSHHAICGAYLFRNRSVFLNASRHYLDHCPDREYFMSGVYNSLLAQGLTVCHVPLDLHLSFGTPAELTSVADHALLAFYCDQ